MTRKRYRLRSCQDFSGITSDKKVLEKQNFWRAKSGLEGWIECFPKARLAGCVFGGGVTGTEEITGKSVMEEAYEMGKKV